MTTPLRTPLGLALLVLLALLLAAGGAGPATTTQTAAATVRQADDDDPGDDESAGDADPCDAPDAAEDCGAGDDGDAEGDDGFGDDALTPQELVEDFLVDTVMPGIYDALGAALKTKVRGATVTVGPLGIYPVNVAARLRLNAPGFKAGEGSIALAAGRTGPLRVALTRRARAALRKKGKLRVSARFDVANDTYAAEWDEERDVVIRGVKKKRR